MSDQTFWAIRKREIASRKALHGPETPAEPKKGRKARGSKQAVEEPAPEPVRVEEVPELQEPGDGAPSDAEGTQEEVDAAEGSA
jgi:hypothetical protein